MEGKIVAAYQTPHGVCYINDAAYAGKTSEQLLTVRREISDTVRHILERVTIDGGPALATLEDRIERRRIGSLPFSAVELPIQAEARGPDV